MFRQQTKTRLQLETLETRDVPSVASATLSGGALSIRADKI